MAVPFMFVDGNFLTLVLNNQSYQVLSRSY